MTLSDLGGVWVNEQRRNAVAAKTGRKRGPYSAEGCEAIAAGKMAFRLGTPWGEFDTYAQLGAHLGKDPDKIKPLFARLDVVPRRPMLDFFGIENPSKLTWRGLGFTQIPK
jgi:hypothetical protein